MRLFLGCICYLIVVLTVVACVDNSSSPDQTQTDGASPSAVSDDIDGGDDSDLSGNTGVVMIGTIEITGEDKVSGGFRNEFYTAQKNCADVVALGSGGSGYGPDGSFSVPGPYFGDPVGGVQYDHSLEIRESKYTRAGTYTLDVISGQIVIGGQANGNRYSKDNGGTGSLELNSDGSGVFTFSDMETADGEVISGTITWTCTGAE
jgi:hypothetical protein